MSLASILGIARTAMQAQQVTMQVTSQNVANAETPGYTRQRTELAAGFPQTFPWGVVGTGVVVQNVTRARDALLDVAYRRDAGNAAGSSLRRDLLQQVEDVLGEPSEIGLAAAMDAFWNGWSDLANAPTSGAARSVVQQRGRTVAAMLNTFSQRLDDARAQGLQRLDQSLQQLNGLADQVAQLNGRIVESEAGGQSANDLRDQRDRLLDQISALGDTRVFEQPDGSVQVVLGNITVVDGIHAKHLESAATGTGVGLRLAGTTDLLQPVGGSLGALTEFVSTDLYRVGQRLDALARTLADATNAVHGAGYTFAGGTPGAPAGAFFASADGGPISARTIGLSAAVAASSDAIAASGNANGATDNAVALALASLRTASTLPPPAAGAGTPISFALPWTGAPETASLADFYRTTVSGLGTQIRDSESAAEVFQTLVGQAERRRQSVSGVSTDEELVQLMKSQQAYAAAAKLVSAVDEMMQSVLDMV